MTPMQAAMNNWEVVYGFEGRDCGLRVFGRGREAITLPNKKIVKIMKFHLQLLFIILSSIPLLNHFFLL